MLDKNILKYKNYICTVYQIITWERFISQMFLLWTHYFVDTQKKLMKL